MDRLFRNRITIVAALAVLIGVVFSFRLFLVQLSPGDSGTYKSSDVTTYSLKVAAARGEILDRHGTVLVSNRATYSVTLNSFVLFNADDPNGLLLRLAETCRKNGIQYEDGLPLNDGAPYSYVEDKVDYTFKKYLLGREWDADMTAENLAKKLRKIYHIPDDYTEEQARLVMGLRYELDLPAYANADVYTLAEDISADQLAILKELAVPGMDVTTTTVREYNTTFAAQLLGYVRAMDPDQYTEIYEPLGYAMDAKVGQEGLEQGFEEYLHGKDGTKVLTVAADGTVLDEYWEVEPKTGGNVVTTIDIGMQEIAEKSLATHIQEVAANRTLNGKADGWDANAGAVVVMNPQNGEVWAAANYPTYDPSDYFDKYNELLDQDVSPLRNRALLNAYPPGSTFKLITATAAMRAGISPATTIAGNGYKEFSDGTRLYCWIYKQGGVHGNLNMVGAIAQSCNIYFYNMGLMIGIDRLDEVATSFGIGQDAGCEVYNNPGMLASKESKAEVYGADTPDGNWWDADTATAAIGQSLNQVTPLQLCRYACAMGNGGTLYNATFLRRVMSADFETTLKVNEYVPAATDLLTEKEYQTIFQGTRACVTEGTGTGLRDFPVECCAKTGTAQHGSLGSDNGAFICWAPAANPEIAIAVYVEHGASGSNFAGVAWDILDYYFNAQYPAQEIAYENEMTEE